MKAVLLALIIVLAAMAPAAATDIVPPQRVYRAAVVRPPPIALRTLSRRSAAVLASTPCWRACTTACAFDFQHCARTDWLAGCMGGNNACERACLVQCRLKGGPLVSWTDY